MLDRILSGLSGLLGHLTAGSSLSQALDLSTTGSAFVPRVTPDFPPLHAVLRREGEPFPVIVEGADVAHARRVLEGEMLQELEHFVSSTSPFEAVPWICLVRGLDGTAEGMALSWLVGRGTSTQMNCDRDRKRILKGEGTVSNVGVALLIAKLLWMKSQGYWSFGREILTNYDPFVMASYRRTCGLEKGVFDDMAIATASVGRSAGEDFLRGCPIPVRPIRG